MAAAASLHADKYSAENLPLGLATYRGSPAEDLAIAAHVDTAWIRRREYSRSLGLSVEDFFAVVRMSVDLRGSTSATGRATSKLNWFGLTCLLSLSELARVRMHHKFLKSIRLLQVDALQQKLGTCI